MSVRLDVSKAFDKVSHFALFVKLIDRSVPVNIIQVLLVWYSNSFACVNWNGLLSDFFPLKAGIRQGGTLSPVLFAVYVNSLLEKLEHSGLGCHVGSFFIGALMYADDLLLITPSVHALQLMINLCVNELDCLDMRINVNKSACIRFGKGLKRECSQVSVGGVPLPWSSKLNYLGITLKSSIKFSVDMHSCRAGFYRSFNSVYSRVSGANVEVIVSLVRSFCFPSLLYCIEALDLNKALLISLDTPLVHAFGKIFKTFDKVCLNYCMFFMNFLPPRFEYIFRKIKFLMKNLCSDNLLVLTLCKALGSNELSLLCEKFGISSEWNIVDIRDSIWNYFKVDIKL